MHDDNLCSFLIQKESWSPQTFDTINWNASERALRRLSKNWQVNVVRLFQNYWYTSSRHVKFYGGDSPCCFYQETKEDCKHIINFPLLDTSYHRDASWQKVKQDMQMWRLPADFCTALEKGLQHLPWDIKESTSPTLPFQISVNPIRNHLRAAFQQQNSIKWTNLLKWRMSHKWQQFATTHVRSKKLDLRAQKLGPKFITALWDHSLLTWHFRNDAFHRDASTQAKRYKLEELERERARLRNRHIELQPILHRFQHKRFKSPDTVNNLRYDSEKCWTALANLFLDEAESRLPSTDNELLPQYLTTRAGIGQAGLPQFLTLWRRVLWLPAWKFKLE
jgi:hypothetical protein